MIMPVGYASFDLADAVFATIRLRDSGYAVTWLKASGLLNLPKAPLHFASRRAGDLPVTKTSDLWSIGENVLAVVLDCFGVRGEAVGEMERRAFDSLEVDPLELRDFAGLEKS